MIDIFLIINLLINFGLMVLVLMVQFTIYPSFLYFKKEDLVKWHLKYTGQIAKIVGPLMLGQLGVSIYFILGMQQYFFGGIQLILVILTWISTALHFVPIHTKITRGIHTDKDLKNLIHRNWLRVFLWILVLSISLIHYTSLVSLRSELFH